MPGVKLNNLASRKVKQLPIGDFNKIPLVDVGSEESLPNALSKLELEEIKNNPHSILDDNYKV